MSKANGLVSPSWRGADRVADTRLTLRQAAAVLGVSESAIRKRVERGTLSSDKGPDGRRYVYLDTVEDNMADRGADASAPREHDALISELRAHNGTLREQLEAERHAHAEARRIIAGLVERLPAIEAAQEARESPQTVEEEPERAETGRTAGEVQESAASPHQRSGWLAPVNKIPWWQYVLGTPTAIIAAGIIAALAWPLVAYLVPPRYPLQVIFVGWAWFLIPGTFGFWVGLKLESPIRWGRSVLTGAIFGLVSGVVLSTLFIDIGWTIENNSIPFLLLMFLLICLPPILAYVSGELIGKALQRRRAEEGYSEIPAHLAQRSNWTPRNQAILGFAGTLIAALLSLVGTIISVTLGGG
jgi:hypothetical protein